MVHIVYVIYCIQPHIRKQVKTRLQILPTRAGMFSTGALIVRSEGPKGLYMGFTAACYRHLIYSGTRYFAYEVIKEKVFTRNADGSFPLWKSAIAAMSAGQHILNACK